MSPELDEALCRDFPNVFKNRHLESCRSGIRWGFECGDGWEPIIREAAAALEAEIAKYKASSDFDPDLELGVADQVKEKFATLRLYIGWGNEEMHRIIEEAERKSETTCESCGAPGKIRGKGWIYNACDNCENRRQANAK